MELKDVAFSPYNDMEIDDSEILTKHNNYIKQNSFSDATSFLNNSNYKKGFRASLFNELQNKIHTLQEYVLNTMVAEHDEYFSYEEPTEEQMKGKTWWIKLY